MEQLCAPPPASTPMTPPTPSHPQPQQSQQLPQYLRILERLELSHLTLTPALVSALLPIATCLRSLSPRSICPSVYHDLPLFVRLESLTLRMGGVALASPPTCASDVDMLSHALRALTRLKEFAIIQWSDFAPRAVAAADLPPVALALTQLLRSTPQLTHLSLANVDCRSLVPALLSAEGPRGVKKIVMQFHVAHCSAAPSRQLGPSAAELMRLGTGMKGLETLVAHFATPMDAEEVRRIQRQCERNNARADAAAAAAAATGASSVMPTPLPAASPSELDYFSSSPWAAVVGDYTAAVAAPFFPALRHFDWSWNQQRVVVLPSSPLVHSSTSSSSSSAASGT